MCVLYINLRLFGIPKTTKSRTGIRDERMTESDEDAAAAEDDPEADETIVLTPRTKKRHAQRAYNERKRQKRLEIKEKAELYGKVFSMWRAACKEHKDALAESHRSQLAHAKDELCWSRREAEYQAREGEYQVSQTFV